MWCAALVAVLGGTAGLTGCKTRRAVSAVESSDASACAAGEKNRSDSCFLPVRFVGCVGPAALTTDEAVLFGHRWESDPYFERVTIDGGRLTWHQHSSTSGRVVGGSGDLAVPGHAPVTLDWDDAVLGIAPCRPTTLDLRDAQETLSTVVRSPLASEGIIEVVGCLGYGRTPPGRFELTVGELRPCQVWARDEEGAWGWPVDVLPDRAPGPLHISTTAREIRLLGVDVTVAQAGLQIVEVDPGMALAFSVGDVLVAIDGKPLDASAEQQPLAVLARALGNHDQTLVLDVLRRTGDRMQMTRRRVE